MRAIKILIQSLSCAFIFSACSLPKGGLFAGKSKTEKSTNNNRYSSTSTREDAKPIRRSRKVDIAIDKALNNPVAVQLPYREASYFETNDASSTGYRFSAKQGERITIYVDRNEDDELFTEIWSLNTIEPGLVYSADDDQQLTEFVVSKPGNYIVRIEPEKLKGFNYTVTISTGPSLGFPINKSDNPRVSSFWGASRDNGARSHEGIDIVAKKYTPVIAVANGYVTAVKDGGLGGKTVSMRPEGTNYSVYYAHLDKQLVHTGQQVRLGDTLGLVGNTGNAAKTVPHLHFGIYEWGEAVDPLAFVNGNSTNPKEVKADLVNINGEARTKTATVLYTQPVLTTAKKINIAANKSLKILAATDDFYRVRLEDGTEGFIKASLISKKKNDTRTVARRAEN